MPSTLFRKYPISPRIRRENPGIFPEKRRIPPLPPPLRLAALPRRSLRHRHLPALPFLSLPSPCFYVL